MVPARQHGENRKLGADRSLLRRLRAAAGGGGLVAVALVLAAPAGAQAPDPSPGGAQPSPDAYFAPAPVQEPQFVPAVVTPHVVTPAPTVQRPAPPRHRRHTAPARKPHRAARPALPARLLRPPAEWIATAGVPLATVASAAERVPRSAALALAAVVLLSATLVLHVARKTAR
jgi:hypothetical protein